MSANERMPLADRLMSWWLMALISLVGLAFLAGGLGFAVYTWRAVLDYAHG